MPEIVLMCKTTKDKGEPANRKKTGARLENGTFPKGKSGNPNGRPKIVEEFRDRARKATDEFVIAAWISEVESMGDNWVKASELLAAYGYGRPAQSMELTGKGGGPIEYRDMTTEQLKALLAQQMAAK